MPARTAHLALQNQGAIHFGAFLHMLRDRHSVRQIAVLACLPGWSQANYSRLEGDVVAPAFADLETIYTALHEAGVLLTAQDRQQYLSLARLRIESKKSYHEQKSDREWDELRLRLSRLDQAEQATTTPQRLPVSSSLLETRHLVGRADWLTSLSAALYGPQPRKLLVLHGPTGIGKSSELHRLARHLLSADAHPHEILCILPDADQQREPENALDHLLGSLLAEIGPPDSAMQAAPVEARITFVLHRFEKMARPVLVLIDNAEQVLESSGQLAACWKQFLKRFLRSQHRAALVLATEEWPGWHEGERVFIEERVIPPLSVDEGIALLHQQGLADIPVEQLQRVCEAVGGIPQCLEWVASLVQEPLWLDTWEALNDLDSETEDSMTRRLQRLLDDNALFGGHVTDRLTPLLDSIIARRLSAEAVGVLHILALANVPLSLSAVQQLCPRPRLLKELESVSLLMAYPKRVQLLPVVASIIRARLPLERQRQLEGQVIAAYRFWLDRGTMSDREMGNIVAELIALYLKQHSLLDAAQHLILYGWMSFNHGHARRLARLARRVLQDMDWHQTAELECAGFAILNILFPFLGKPYNEKDYVDYRQIYNTLLIDKVVLSVEIKGYITQILMQRAMNEQHFEEAQAVLDAYLVHLEAHGMGYMKEYTSVIQKRAWLLTVWCEYAEEQGNMQKAQSLRKQAIDIYRQCEQLLSSNEDEKPFPYGNIYKRRLANCLTYLGFHLNRIGQYEEALQIIDRAITLHEQGYAYVGALASSYGEKSQILMGLGRFQEALMFDEKALAEVQRCADSGDLASQEEVWIYKVNRGRLYLRLGKVDEAEQLLQEAKLHIHPRRNMYRMFAEEAEKEIMQWRQQATSSKYQLDWRWIERYRKLVSYDSYWWLTWAGPFTEEEQGQWDRLFISPVNEAAKEQLAPLLKQSRERELEAALAEQREPHLLYPAIEIDEVRQRVADLLQLHTEISREEPNAIVRRLYHGAIEEELDFLQMIEATHEKDTEQFWKYALRSFPIPTAEEMNYALARVRDMLIVGVNRSETAEISQRLETFLRTHLHLTLDLSSNKNEPQRTSSSFTQSEQEISAQAARRFFQAVLHDCDYDGWSVVIDSNATNARIEQGLRRIFLPDQRFSLGEIRHLLSHELLGHVSRCVAGERSLIGLLGISTKDSASVEEGLALYHERHVASLHGQPFNDAGIRNGTLATGLASGTITPPQTFLSLVTFFEMFSTLSRLLRNPDANLQEIQQAAREYALSMCLRAYRGVPDLNRAGVCNLQDATHLHGLRLVEQAVAQDESVLDRLAAGVVSLEVLPELQELGIYSAQQPLRKLAYNPDLDSYILSFEQIEATKEVV